MTNENDAGLTCCQDLKNDDHSDVMNLNSVLTYPVANKACRRRANAAALLPFKLLRCIPGLTLTDPACRPSVFLHEKLRLPTTGRRCRWDYDNETQPHFRSEQILQNHFFS